MAPKSAAAATTTAAAASRRRAAAAAPSALTKKANGRRRVKANVARVSGGDAETATMATTTAAPASASAGDGAAMATDGALRSGSEFVERWWRESLSECEAKLCCCGERFFSPSTATSHLWGGENLDLNLNLKTDRTRRRVRRPSSAAAGDAPPFPPPFSSPPQPSSSLSAVRHAAVSRVTKETSVDVAITIDGTGACSSRSSVPFLDHMLDQLASHGLFDVAVKASGDTWIDDHHTNEDVALALGTALARALGDRRGIVRFGDFSAPLDEALVHVVLDLSGRPHLSCDLRLPTERIGTYETQLVEHFFQSLVNTSGMTLHIRQLAGTNSHHIVEATFKAFARALRQACERDPRREGSVASSKGVLTQA